MENYYSDLDQYFAVDSKHSFLSLQLLEQFPAQAKPQYTQSFPQPQHKQIYTNIYEHHQYKQHHIPYSTQESQSYEQKTQHFSKKYSQQSYPCADNKSVRYSDPQNQSIPFHNKLQRGLSMTDQNCSDILKSLDNSKISRLTSKKEGCESHRQNNLDSPPREELAMLKQLKQQAFATLYSNQHAEQVKENFQVLFQKVYGIIQEIQQRSQRTEMIKSVRVPRKQLCLSTRVLELSVGKDSAAKKKKFCTIQTDYDYEKQSCDQNIAENIENRIGNWTERTPMSSAHKVKKTNLLTLSKQLPYASTPKNNNLGLSHSNRSNRSKSKGLSLVSAEKRKLEPKHFETQFKKPVKISLVQKKIVMCPKQKKQPVKIQAKVSDKKISGFNANNFYNSRRVTNTRVF